MPAANKNNSSGQSEHGTLGRFLHKLSDWKFCPPSGHLWTIQIKLHNNGLITEKGNNAADFSFGKLFENILAVNSLYHSTFGSSYKVSIKGDDENKLLFDYVNSLHDSEIGLFLANEITFNANDIKVQDVSSQQNQNFTGWLSYGKIATGRSHNHNGKISFYSTNWNISEIIMDKWIAAIGQQGLIEGDEDNDIFDIKADIYINEYSASTPDSLISGMSSWQLRKIIKLTKAFPKARDPYKFSYTEDATDMQTLKVDFEFENYAIEYEKADYRLNKTGLVLNTNTSEGGRAQDTNMYRNAQGMA